MKESGFIDNQVMQRAFDRAATTYAKNAVLQEEVRQRLIERLEYLRMVPETVLDLGSGHGAAAAGLKNRYPDCTLFAQDISHAMLKLAQTTGMSTIQGNADSMPFQDNSMDLIFSNLMLQWSNEPGQVFLNCAQALRHDGLLTFTTFGPDTLKELRLAWSTIDDFPHVNKFIDMHDLGDALLQAGFADPVMDSEPFTLTYKTMRGFFMDLKAIGATNAAADRRRGLLGKDKYKKLEAAYEQFRQDDVLPATYEVIYGHAWANKEKGNKNKTNNAGETVIDPDSIYRRH